MNIYSWSEKIFAVWDSEHLPNLRDFDKNDAGPDGLSGKIEGFYFANWLIPFNISFKISNSIITYKNYPGCVGKNQYPCSSCQFFNLDSCPILSDEKNIELTIRGFEMYLMLLFNPRGGWAHRTLFNFAQKELLVHGKPLHYQVLYKILQKRYPNLDETDTQLRRILKLNPLFFQDFGDGAYLAIPGVKSNKVDASLWELEMFYEAKDNLFSDWNDF
jgi:hypothetical protein